MYHKLTFILPRAAAVALIAGLGALVLFVVFKLLIFLLAIGFIALGVKAISRAFRQNEGAEDASFGAPVTIIPLEERGYGYRTAVRREQTIIPIG